MRRSNAHLHPFIRIVEFHIDYNPEMSLSPFLPILTFQFSLKPIADNIWVWISSLVNLEELEFHGELLELVVPPIRGLRRLLLRRWGGLLCPRILRNIVPQLADFYLLESLEIDGSIHCSDDASATLQTPCSVQRLSIGQYTAVSKRSKSQGTIRTVPNFAIWNVRKLYRVLEVLKSSLNDLSILSLRGLTLPALRALQSLKLDGRHPHSPEFVMIAPHSDCWPSLSALSLTRISISQLSEEYAPIYITHSLSLKDCVIKVHVAIRLLQVEQTKFRFVAFNMYSFPSPSYKGRSNEKVAVWVSCKSKMQSMLGRNRLCE
ncbi:hypothetical protein BT69DRAFT_1285126 [Atractiella rhizophila]|nr:hypothetical protein BT69DRAFT_1285126 [Atractiella rhizophila]